MKFFFQCRLSRLVAVCAMLPVVFAGTAALGQQDRGRPNGDRPGRAWQRGGGPDGGRRGERRGDRENGEQPREENSRPAESSAPAASVSTVNSFGTTSESDKVRKWASDTVAKHDKNGNKILEGDELDGLSSYSRSADTSGDGKITVDELYQFSSKRSSSAAAATPATPSPSTTTSPAAAEPKDRKIVNDKRKSYRFKSTKDRINNWKFSSRDANGDGQVSMSEYTRSWNDRTAAEFMRYDKDNDGMITAEEAK